MRIIFITTKINLKRGGDSHDLFMKVKTMKEAGHDVKLVTTFSNLNDKTGLPFDIIEEHISPDNFFKVHRFAFKLLKKYQNQTDIFYLAGPSFCFGAGAYKRFIRNSKPIVLYFNSLADFIEGYFRQPPLWPKEYLKEKSSLMRRWRYLVRIFFERSFGMYLVNGIEKIFVFSETIVNLYARAGVKREKMLDVGDFHNIEFLTKPSNSDRVLKGDPDRFQILYTGRMTRYKGVDLFTKIYKKLKHPEKFNFHLVGDGHYKKKLVEEIKQAGLENNIFIYPWKTLEELMPFYEQADVFIHIARHPGFFCRTIVEALAKGLPLIVNDSCVYDWVDSVAKTFKAGDPISIAAAIEDMYSDEDFRRQTKQAGLDIIKNYDYHKQAKRLESIFWSIVK